MASIISASTTSATALNMSADTTGVLQFATGATPTTAVTIDTSQNVGIGTSSFAFSAAGRGDLEIAGSSTALVGLKGGSNQAYIYNDGTSVYVANNSASGNIVFQPANYAERMRIDSSGYVTKPYQVAFNAYNASGTASNPTIFASTTLNIGSAYNTSNGRFTAPVSGRYLICTNIHGGNAVGGTADFRLQKNGSVIEGGGACRSPSYYAQATGAVVVQLSAGDYLTVLTYVNFTNTIELTYFSGYLLG